MFLLDSEYYLENIERVAWHLEAPINHPNTVAIYKLSQRAKDYVQFESAERELMRSLEGGPPFYDISYPFRSRKFLHEIKKNLFHPE